AALGAARIGDQRRYLEPPQGQRVLDHRLGVGELRQELRRDERRDLDLAHPGGVFGVEPGELGLGRQDMGDALQAVAHPDFADLYAVAHLSPPAAITEENYALRRASATVRLRRRTSV